MTNRLIIIFVTIGAIFFSSEEYFNYQENSISKFFLDNNSIIRNLDLEIKNNYDLDYLYFSSDFAISRLNKLTGDIVDLLKIPEKTSVHVYDNYIYYSIKKEDEFFNPTFSRIYRCTLDGLNNELVWDSESLFDQNSNIGNYMEKLGYLSGYDVIGDCIYILITDNPSSFYLLISYNMLTKENDLLINGIGSYGFIGNDCYYTEEFGRTYTIYKKNMTVGEVEVIRGTGEYDEDKDIVNNEFYEDVITSGGEMFYTTRYSQRVYKLGEEDTLIFDAKDYTPSRINLHSFNGNLYLVLVGAGNHDDLADLLFEYNPTNDKLSFIIKFPHYGNADVNFVIIDNMLFFEQYLFEQPGNVKMLIID